MIVAKNTFSMHPQKSGRMKYLLLTLVPPLLLMESFRRLIISGIIPDSVIIRNILLYAPLSIMAVLAYYLIFRKNHSIDVKNNTITEINWLGKKSNPIKTDQIHSYRKNVLIEIILLDENGSKLLCVEQNMSNFDCFEKWLKGHNIYQS